VDTFTAFCQCNCARHHYSMCETNIAQLEIVYIITACPHAPVKICHDRISIEKKRISLIGSLDSLQPG
jgi:hypothetical protein